MFDCPQCHAQVPKSKSLFLNKSSKIECEHCHAVLVPKEETIKKIGAVGGAVGAVGALIAFQTVGWIGVLFVLVIGQILFAGITMSYVEFEKLYP